MNTFKRWFKGSSDVQLNSYSFDETTLTSKLIDDWTIKDIEYCVKKNKLLDYYDETGNYLLNHMVANSIEGIVGYQAIFDELIVILFDRYDDDKKK